MLSIISQLVQLDTYLYIRRELSDIYTESRPGPHRQQWSRKITVEGKPHRPTPRGHGGVGPQGVTRVWRRRSQHSVRQAVNAARAVTPRLAWPVRGARLLVQVPAPGCCQSSFQSVLLLPAGTAHSRMDVRRGPQQAPNARRPRGPWVLSLRLV